MKMPDLSIAGYPMEENQKELQDASGLPEDPATRPKEKPVVSYGIDDPEALDREAERMRAAAAIKAAEQRLQGPARLRELAEQTEDRGRSIRASTRRIAKSCGGKSGRRAHESEAP